MPDGICSYKHPNTQRHNSTGKGSGEPQPVPTLGEVRGPLEWHTIDGAGIATGVQGQCPLHILDVAVLGHQPRALQDDVCRSRANGGPPCQQRGHLSVSVTSVLVETPWHSPSSRGRRVMAVLSRPLPRLTKCGFSVCTLSPLPVSIRSRGLFCRRRGRDTHSSCTCSPLPCTAHMAEVLQNGHIARVNAQAQPHGSRTVQQQDAGEEGSPACATYPRKQRRAAAGAGDLWGLGCI